MAVLDYDKKEVNAKIVYYGPALSGKTTNIHYIYSKLLSEHRGELMTLSTKSHRTLFFDFLPVELGEVKGFNTRFYLYTVPGQIFYNNIRKEVLRNVDGIVFVADSQVRIKQDNIQSYQNLEQNLSEMGRSFKDIPHVMQYNKRDIQEIQNLEDMHRQLNKYNAPFFEGIATQGVGVLKSLTTISKMVLKKLRESPEYTTQEAVTGGPKEAYGLSDEFIALSREEAKRLQAQVAQQGQAPPPPPPAATAPSPPAPQAAQAPRHVSAQSSAPPPAQPQSPSPVVPPAPAQKQPRPVPQAQASQPQQSQPQQASGVSGAPGQLTVIQWGNPQLIAKNTLRLPVTFRDSATGRDYNSTITISLEGLIPKT
jgi:signal recognition particle receptor subunit beta